MSNDSEADRAYTEWLAKEVKEAIDDPRPSIPHAEVVAEWDEWVKRKVSEARAGLADGSNKAYSQEEWANIRQAEEAIAHDAWFRAEVEQGIKEADDPNTQWVSNEEAKAISAKWRAELLKRAGKA